MRYSGMIQWSEIEYFLFLCGNKYNCGITHGELRELYVDLSTVRQSTYARESKSLKRPDDDRLQTTQLVYDKYAYYTQQNT